MKKCIALILVFIICLSVLGLSGCSRDSSLITLYEFNDNYKEGTPITKKMVKTVQVNISDGFVGSNGNVYTEEALAKLTLITEDNWSTFVVEGAVLRNSVKKGSLFVVEQSVVWCKYEDIYNLYMDSRQLYEMILKLDTQIEQNPTQVTRKDYEILLDSINMIYTSSAELNAPKEYAQIRSMINAWLSADAAIYCHKVFDALKQNSTSALQQAQEYKTLLYNDFIVISQKLIEICEAEGYDATSIKTWQHTNENWWKDEGNTADPAGVLSPEIPMNFIPVPGSIEVYMVIDENGNIEKYCQRVQQEDGTWVWSNIDASDISEGYEAVPGLWNIYKVINEDGSITYFKYVRNDDNSYAFIPVNENGKET